MFSCLDNAALADKELESVASEKKRTNGYLVC